MPVLAIVAGPNGSGKTTLVRNGALDGLVHPSAVCLNADDIARMFAAGGQPSDSQSLYAAQVCDRLLDERIGSGNSAVVETVLSSDKYKSRVLAAREAGFQIVLVYVSVKTAELNIARVSNRLVSGGHGVPPERIVARRARSHEMFAWFAVAADRVVVFDNSLAVPSAVAFKDRDGWTLRNLDALAPGLAGTIQTLADAKPEL